MSSRAWVLALAFLSTVAWSRGTSVHAADQAPTGTLKRDYERCHTYADVDACYDAIRWSPADPALLVALGDALVRAKRPADAIRKYRRALELKPNMRGVAAKISAAEAQLPSKQARGKAAGERAAGGPSPKRYSNAAPESQSH